MPAFRCSTCGINYPYHASYAQCQVCDGKTSVMGDAVPNADWEERVKLARLEDVAPDDRVYRWRFDQLRAAGFSEGSSAEMAFMRDIDLHRAVSLAQDAGPELAYRILT